MQSEFSAVARQKRRAEFSGLLMTTICNLDPPSVWELFCHFWGQWAHLSSHERSYQNRHTCFYKWKGMGSHELIYDIVRVCFSHVSSRLWGLCLAGGELFQNAPGISIYAACDPAWEEAELSACAKASWDHKSPETSPPQKPALPPNPLRDSCWTPSKRHVKPHCISLSFPELPQVHTFPQIPCSFWEIRAREEWMQSASRCQISLVLCWFSFFQQFVSLWSHGASWWMRGGQHRHVPYLPQPGVIATVVI